ncbi:MAG: 1-deoxy-D-xylulose-5-phosphate reductoisomerase [bacterium]|nr:1-deoxy-D-xylulose-5-phosphate reductoisomerase [bacterium]
MATRVTILGATGSIGRSALDVVRRYPDQFEVAGLAVQSNVDLLADQIAEFNPPRVAVVDTDAALRLSNRVAGVEVLAGPEGLEELAQADTDVVLCAIVGAAGLGPILAAIEAGHRIALANKEPLVMAGELVMARARERGVKVLPVDSEHSAIFQCLEGRQIEEVTSIHLTASGGPFYRQPREALQAVTPNEAASHPTWDMGRKISVDSATLMNKGLEVIEAMWLFGAALDRIQVVIHPQSIVHSLVEFTDGGILAHLGPTDMKFPIQYALTWPDRAASAMGRLDLTTMPALTFAAPEFDEFPCLGYAREAARAGGTAPAILNAANEEAVRAFCGHRIAFLQIGDVVRAALDGCEATDTMTLEAVMEADAAARRHALDVVCNLEP